MTATSSTQRLWLTALCLLAVAVPGQRLRADDGNAGDDDPDYAPPITVPRVAGIHRGALSTTENRIIEWVPRLSFELAHLHARLHERMATRERLKSIHGSFFRWKSPDALPPTMAGGRELPLPSMIDMIRLYHPQNEFMSISLSGPVPPDMQSKHLWGTFWPTAAELPCFATDYDKAVAEVSARYERLKEHSATRLADSLRRADDPGFFTVIEWELARAGR